MTKRFGRPILVAAVAIFCASALLLAHDPKKKTAMTGDMMNECGEHHSAAMKASDEVKIHLAEAKKAGTLAEMRRHVELAQASMADMEKHMSMCMETMDKTHGEKMDGGGTTPSSVANAVKVTDPVCGMEVTSTNPPTATYKGQTYSFCSEEDKSKFVKNPEQYAGKKP